MTRKNIQRRKGQKRRTMRARNTNKRSKNRRSENKRSKSRRSVNRRNISRTKKNMKGGSDARKRGATPMKKEAIPAAQIPEVRKRNRQEILNEIINKLSQSFEKTAFIPQETAARLGIEAGGGYYTEEALRQVVIRTFPPESSRRAGHAGNTGGPIRRTSTRIRLGNLEVYQGPYTYIIGDEEFETPEQTVQVKMPKKKTLTLRKPRIKWQAAAAAVLSNFSKDRHEEFKTSKEKAWHKLIELLKIKREQLKQNRDMRFYQSKPTPPVTQEHIDAVAPLTLDELFDPRVESDWIHPLYECLCYNFMNGKPGRRVATYDYSYDKSGINFNRILLLQNVANDQQCYRTMISQSYGAHPTPFAERRICASKAGSITPSPSCWEKQDSTATIDGVVYNQYKFRNEGIEREANPYSQCWLCGEDLVCNVRVGESACQKPPQCEHKFAVIEGILLTTIPNVWKVDQSGGHFFGDNGYAPSCAFCNETKSNLIMSKPEMTAIAISVLGTLYEYEWMANQTNVSILFANYSDTYGVQSRDGDRKIQFSRDEWNPNWDYRFRAVMKEINTILTNSLNNPGWLESVYYDKRFYSHKIYCSFYYTDTEGNELVRYINPFQLLAHVISRQYMGYTKEINNMYVLFHNFLRSYIKKTEIVINIKYVTMEVKGVKVFHNLLLVTESISPPGASLGIRGPFGTIQVYKGDAGYFTIPEINQHPVIDSHV